MKLITEYNDALQFSISEAAENGSKSYFIEGVFMQSDKQNRNGRIYPKATMERAVNKYYKEQVATGRAVGELDHPDSPMVNMQKVSHRITDLRMEGADVIGKALILDTPMGKIVKGLMEGGVKLGVSSRGMGSLMRKEGVNMVGDDFVISTVDIVQDPSAPDAFVNGIMEGVDWVYQNGLLKAEQIEKYETEVKRSTKANRSDIAEAVFMDFLSRL